MNNVTQNRKVFIMRNKKAFTLAELLVVVAIIAILVAIAIPTFSSATRKAEEATIKANMRTAYAEQTIADLMAEAGQTSPDTNKVLGQTIDGYTYSFADGKITVTGTDKPFNGAYYDGTNYVMQSSGN